MSDGAVNAAVEFMQLGFSDMNSTATFDALGRGPKSRIPDDCILEDRRTGGVNFGRLDGRGYRELLSSAWDVGGRRPYWSIQGVIAIRGQRCAAIRAEIDFANNIASSLLFCVRLSPDLDQMERGVYLDVEDVETAIAELDRLQAETDDCNPSV